MPRWRDALDALLGRSVKAVPTGPYAGQSLGWGVPITPLLPGARKDWAKEAGDLWRNTAVACCLGWLQDNFVTARLQVVTPGERDERGVIGDDEPDDDHPLLELLGPGGRPNDSYAAEDLWAATVLSYKVEGNAYWIKARGMGGAGQPMQLWWEPHFNVRPWRAPNSVNLVDVYYVRRPEREYAVLPAEIVHFRDGIDPYNPMLGCSRLKTQMRNAAGLNSGETFTASIVDNMGAIGVVWMPENEPVDEAEAGGIKRALSRAVTRENAGKAHAMTHPGRLERLGQGPEELALTTILDRPEASICGILGVNPMVVGLAVGATMRSYANQEEADKQSWNNGLVPMQTRMARGALTTQLLQDFPGSEGLTCRWDYSGVTALQRNSKEQAEEASMLMAAELVTVNEARKIVGLPPVDDGDKSPIERAEEAAQQQRDMFDREMEVKEGSAAEDDDAEAEPATNGRVKAKGGRF